MIDGYMSPEEAAAASLDQTDKALGAVIAMLYELYMEKRNIRLQIETEMDEEMIGELEYQLKLLKSEETSLHRIESGLQSRCRTGAL